MSARITRNGKPAAILMADVTEDRGPDRYRADPIVEGKI